MTPQNLVTLPREVVEQALNLVAGPNWGTVGYMDMQVYDDAKKLEKQLRAALTEQVQPCIGKDPLCPCQDGDACHYKDAGDTKAFPVKVEQVHIDLVEAAKCIERAIRAMIGKIK